MQPDFNRLKVFYYIYSRKSVVAAANDLHITQSAVSQHLQKLESELKTPLFTRLHKRLIPTIAADNLFGIMKPFMEELEKGVRHINQAREKPSGLLRIGAPVEFGKEYFPRLFATFRKQHPDVVFYLKLGDPATLLPMVAEGELDFTFVDEFLTREQFFGDLGLFSIEPIVEEEVILACSSNYNEEKLKGDHSYENLVKKDFISYQEHASALIGWFKHHYKKSTKRLNIVLTVDSLQAVVSGILNDLGLGIIATHISWKDIRKGRIVPISTPKEELINKISLVQLQEKIPSLTEKTFQSHFRKEIHETGVLKTLTRISDTDKL